MRKARSRSVDKSQRIALTSIEDVERPSKLEIGMNLFDVVPQSTDESEEEAVEGGIESLLYPRPEKGWRKHKREEDHKPDETAEEDLATDKSSLLATSKLMGVRSTPGHERRRGVA